MPRLGPESPKVVIRKLHQLGFDGPFGGGRHVYMRHPRTKLKIPIPRHGKDIPVGTIRAIIRQVGVSVEDWKVL